MFASIARYAISLVVPVLLLLACGSSGDDEISLSGDVPELESVATRGDTLLARSADTAWLADSIRRATAVEAEAIAAGQGRSVGRDSAVEVTPGATDDLTASSPARAAAQAIMQRALARAASEAPPPPSGTATASRNAPPTPAATAAAMPAASSPAAPSAASRDSLRGLLIASAGAGGGVALRIGEKLYGLSGVGTTGLAPLVGTEVMVRGVQVSPRDLVVVDFVVRQWQGLPVVDGVVQDDGSIRLADGSGVRRVRLPVALRDRVGARVWIAFRNGSPAHFDLVPR